MKNHRSYDGFHAFDDGVGYLERKVTFFMRQMSTCLSVLLLSAWNTHRPTCKKGVAMLLTREKRRTFAFAKGDFATLRPLLKEISG